MVAGMRDLWDGDYEAAILGGGHAGPVQEDTEGPAAEDYRAFQQRSVDAAKAHDQCQPEKAAEFLRTNGEPHFQEKVLEVLPWVWGGWIRVKLRWPKFFAQDYPNAQQLHALEFETAQKELWAQSRHHVRREEVWRQCF